MMMGKVCYDSEMLAFATSKSYSRLLLRGKDADNECLIFCIRHAIHCGYIYFASAGEHQGSVAARPPTTHPPATEEPPTCTAGVRNRLDGGPWVVLWWQLRASRLSASYRPAMGYAMAALTTAAAMAVTWLYISGSTGITETPVAVTAAPSWMNGSAGCARP